VRHEGVGVGSITLQQRQFPDEARRQHMTSHKLKLYSVVMAAMLPVFAAAAASKTPPKAAPAAAVMPAAKLSAQTDEVAGLTITVKPLRVAVDAKTWSFEVNLNTRSGDLADDMLHSAYLVNRSDKSKSAPTAWVGDAAGGSHRKGVLQFKAITPLPKAIELRIERASEKAPRIFRWDLDCPCNDTKMHSS